MLVFKESWHRADLEPGATQKYLEITDLVKKMQKCLGCHAMVGSLALLELNPFVHRRVFLDMRHSDAVMALFFTLNSEVSEETAKINIREHFIMN